MVLDKRVTAAVDEALSKLIVTARDVAAASGISYDALASYRGGRRGVPTVFLESLAEIMEQKSHELASVAKKLRKEAQRVQ